MNLNFAEGGVRVGDAAHLEVWVVAKDFCVVSKMNDPRYSDGDLEGPKARDGSLTKSKANPKFLGARVRTMKDLTNFKTISVVATVDIEAGEEIFAEYGEDSSI